MSRPEKSIRPFDEIFRENQMGGGQQQQQGGQQGNNEQQRLVELQKQIINATWRLQRERPTAKRTEDAGVVRESQQQALLQAESGAGEAFDPGQQARTFLVDPLHLLEVGGRLGLPGKHFGDETILFIDPQPPVGELLVSDRAHGHAAKALAARGS